jgi:hypothetical protein
LKNRKSGSGSLKHYELTNLLFFLVLIGALGVVVFFVFRHYSATPELSEGGGVGVINEALDSGSDIGMFFLDTKISEASIQCRGRIDIPVTDDGFIRELFSLPGVEEVTIDQKRIMLRKSASAKWEAIEPGVKRIAKNHLHTHF